MKHNKYYIWLTSGFLCFVLFFKLLNIPYWLSIILDIISIFAGGVFASTVVAIFVEKINSKYYFIQIQRQKRILINDIVICIPWLIKSELRNLDNAYYLCGNIDMKRKNIEIATYDSIDKIENYILKIQEIVCNHKNIPVIDNDYLIKQSQFESSVFSSNLGYYKNLNKYFLNILKNKAYYLINDILSDKDLEILHQTFGILDDLIKFCESKSIDYTLDFKDMFFKEIKNFIQHFGLHEYYNKITHKHRIYFID